MTVAGRCFSRSHRDGTLYLFLLGDKGEVEQWGLATDAAGAMRGRIARRGSLGSEAGYCAADHRGAVYIAQEGGGPWRFDADTRDGNGPDNPVNVRPGQHGEEERKNRGKGT